MITAWLRDPAGRPVVVRTSGSSAEPKDVALSAAAVTAAAEATLSRLGGGGQWLLALPVAYVAGLQVVVRSVLAGRPVVVLEEHPDLVAAAAALATGRHYLAAVPTQLHRWLRDERSAKAVAGLDAVLIGGGAARASLLDEARAAGINVVTTYGMSETCGGCVYDGVALDGVGVRLDADGRIWLSGPMLFDGYVDKPDLTAGVLRAGWLRTPDVGRLDAAGRLEVLGRADEVVVSGGVNVPLPAVEATVASIPGVRECAALAFDDAEWGMRVVAVVVADPVPPLAAVRDFVAARHPRSWAPREIVAVQTIPMLESGKPDRRALRATVLAAVG